MSLADQFNTVPIRKLSLDEWVAGLSKEDRAAFESVMANPGAAMKPILKILRANGCATTPESLKAWRARVTR